MTSFLVVGCGNEMAGDDGAGLKFVKKLRSCPVSERAGVELIELSYSGLELLDLFDRAELILFVDAVASGALPGTVHLAELPCPGLEPRALHRFSTHGWDLPEVLQLARALRRRVPRIVLLGFEAGSTNSVAACSAPVCDAIEQVIAQFSELRNHLWEWQESTRPLNWTFAQLEAKEGSL